MQAHQIEGSFCDFKANYLPCLQKILSRNNSSTQQTCKEIEYIIANTPPQSDNEEESESSGLDQLPAKVPSTSNRKISRAEWALRQLKIQ